MDSKFVKLIDYSLLPFSLTILGKTIGLYLVINWLGIDWGVGNFGNSFISVTPVVYGRDLSTVATYSNLFMFVVLFIGFSVFLLISNLRHNQKLGVGLFRRLMQLRFLNLFQKGIFLYTRMFVWLAYIWMVVLYIIIDALLGRSEMWLAAFAFVLTGLVTATTYLDIMKEYRNLVDTSKSTDYL